MRSTCLFVQDRLATMKLLAMEIYALFPFWDAVERVFVLGDIILY
jgi:hypothetical protein